MTSEARSLSMTAYRGTESTFELTTTERVFFAGSVKRVTLRTATGVKSFQW